jgi:deoxyribonuclease V
VIAVLDAAYANDASVAACVTASGWEAAKALGEFTHRSGPAAEYEPGEFYRRELPLLKSVLAMLPATPQAIVIDGYVWLGVEGRKGLGAHLFEALGGATAIVGIAKTQFQGASYWAAQVKRGSSDSPLYVTAAGLAVEDAVAAVKRMDGAHRIPTLVAQADAVARAALRGS